MYNVGKKKLIYTGGVLRCLHGGNSASSCKDIIFLNQFTSSKSCISDLFILRTSDWNRSSSSFRMCSTDSEIPPKQNTVSSKYSYEKVMLFFNVLMLFIHVLAIQISSHKVI